jgi:hypothetical protein
MHVCVCVCVCFGVVGAGCTQTVFVAHSIFAMIIGATYTGAVAAFLISTSNIPTVDDFDSLATGKFGVAIQGPQFDSSVLISSVLFYSNFSPISNLLGAQTFTLYIACSCVCLP